MNEIDINSTKFVKEVAPIEMERSPMGNGIVAAIISVLIIILISVWRRKRKNR
jgi:hypothetical protein